ncbi:hypothetical protein C8P66_103202 [Humitalea rosea]|uniref:Inhibitor of lysozyme (Ivy) n=2 Tax=Humitalea rosea TaxID=990373 RepID=A0A2W7IRV8_9PROT|nr:hypothetical protein C8P66_103202 [Humitalea rosea]
MRRWLLAGVLLAGTAAAAVPEDESPEDESYVGRPLLALVSYPNLPSLLRQVSGGQQGAMARAVRFDGPGLELTAGRYLNSYACAPKGCAEDGVFLAYDTEEGRIFLMLVREGSMVIQVPPRRAPWPDVLEARVAAFGAAPGSLTYAPPP